MTLPPDPEADPAAEAEKVRRSKLIGRIIIIAFGILLLIYFVPLALNFVR